jgi:hypothetical protein
LGGEKRHTMVLADWGVPSSRLVVALTGPSFCEVGVYVWVGPSIGVCMRGRLPGAYSGKAAVVATTRSRYLGAPPI